ncbi:FAD-binding domain-containing protein [Xylariaceae sp. FL1019]|nr:FAD-binding domain-containing protein [Xylariaceae sp. FL1019]
MRFAAYYSVFLTLLTAGYASTAQPEARDGPESRSCKAFPGTPFWPSEETWTRFNTSLGGKLITPVAPGAVCHPGQATYDADKCVTVTKQWTTYDFHQRDPVSNMWQQYNNDTCLVDPDTPCSIAGYPAYVVNATTAEDVQLSLKFARKHNIRVVVKSSGHDYQGRSQAPGALSIWVHHMQGPLQTHDSFKPQGCDFTIEGSAVTALGGTQIGQLYDDLDVINQTIVGGGSKSVAVGGYITGGGHSILGPHYGMAADQVLEIELVTPTGEILTVNECQNTDLFWAMRGGGGSTFGVMTSVTMATHPSPKLVSGIVGILTYVPDAPYLWDMVGYIMSQMPYLDSQGVSGYVYTVTNYTIPYGNTTIQAAGVGGLLMVTGTQDPNIFQTIFDPIITHVNSTWSGTAAFTTVDPYPSFKSWFDVYYDQNPAGYDYWVGSHLMDAKSLSNATALANSSKIARNGAYLVAGEGVRNAKPRGGSNAVNPSWRRAVIHATTGKEFAPLNVTAKADAQKYINDIAAPLRQLAPDMGAYVNENSPGEPNWEHSFWGENYGRLLEIKRTVDPEDVLWCHPCVGNDRWEVIGARLCRVDAGRDETSD